MGYRLRALPLKVRGQRSLANHRCVVESKRQPFRRIIYTSTNQVNNCVLGSLLVFGVFLKNTMTISCPGGAISTMCSDNFLRDIRNSGAKNIIVMGGTNNLFDRENRRLMGPVETADQMYYLIRILKFHGYNVELMELSSRRDKYSTSKALNGCYQGLARELKVPFYNHRKFRYRHHMSAGGIHPDAKHVRELAADFREAFNKLKRKSMSIR